MVSVGPYGYLMLTRPALLQFLYIASCLASGFLIFCSISWVVYKRKEKEIKVCVYCASWRLIFPYEYVWKYFSHACLVFPPKYTLRATRKTVQTCSCVFFKTLLVLFYWVAPREYHLTFLNWYCHYNNRTFPFFMSQHLLLLVCSTHQKELGIRNVQKEKILPNLKRTRQTWGKKGGTQWSQRWQGLQW